MLKLLKRSTRRPGSLIACLPRERNTPGLGIRLPSEVARFWLFATLQFVHERAVLLAFRGQKLVFPCHPSAKVRPSTTAQLASQSNFLARKNKTGA